MKNILHPHCTNCGGETESIDSYSDCCNESIEDHGYETLEGELKSALYWPNGTNEPGVEKTCENQGYCFHD
jgi:hypothetical protein